MKELVQRITLWFFQKLNLVSKRAYDNYKFNLALIETGVKTKEIKINRN